QANRAVFIGDHILKVVARADGNVGSEIQDICILGFASCRGFVDRFTQDSELDDCRSFGRELPNSFFYTPNFFTSVFSGGEPFTVFADPLFPFASCKDAALWERTFFYDLSPPECRQFGGPRF
ncbi:MAG: hypothetical protein ACREOW_04545, partial [Thermodesulfobacteriota bacterium]